MKFIGVILAVVLVVGSMFSFFHTIHWLVYRDGVVKEKYSKATYEDFLREYNKRNMKPYSYSSILYEDGSPLKETVVREYQQQFDGVDMLLGPIDYYRFLRFFKEQKAKFKPNELPGHFNQEE